MKIGNKKITEAVALKMWHAYQNGSTQIEISKKFGYNKSTVNRWFGIIQNTPALLAQYKKQYGANGSRVKKESPTAQRISDLDALQDENSFLLWWNEGERKGYVDKLLKKVQE